MYKPALSIDWTNPKAKVSQYFTVHECLWLPRWKRLANEADGLNDEIKFNLFETCALMDIVREDLATPINVHIFYRPHDYNKLVGGAAQSAHLEGKAVDFSVSIWDCDDVRAKIISRGLLDKLKLRMEDLPGSNWVHLDTRAPGPSGKRFFKPL